MATLLPDLSPRAAYMFERESWQGAGDGAVRSPSLDVDEKDHLFVGGAFENTFWYGDTPVESYGPVDGFVMKLDLEGGALWARTLHGTDEQMVNAVSAGPVLDFVAGTFRDSVSGGWSALDSNGLEDVFVLGLPHDD